MLSFNRSDWIILANWRQRPLLGRNPNVALVLTLAIASCKTVAAPAAPVSTVDAASETTAPALCPAATAAAANGTCLPVGPAGCDSATDPQACVPRWCWRWRDGAGQACVQPAADCSPTADACDESDPVGSGCPAGFWRPPSATGPCQAAGAPLTAPVAATLAADAAVPPLPPLPATDAIAFCADSTAADPKASLHPCRPDEKGCGKGKMPDGLGGCQPVGAGLVCPPGFIAQALAKTAVGLPACLPDPADCGTGTYGDGDVPFDAVFVDANALPNGGGTYGSPYQDLPTAIAAASAGAVVLLAAGDYMGGVTVKKEMQVRGRCAAMVRISDPAELAMWVELPAGAQLSVQRLSIVGSGAGIQLTGMGATLIDRVFIHGISKFSIAVVGQTSAVVTDTVVDNSNLPPRSLSEINRL